MVFDLDMIRAFYAAMPGRIAAARKVVGKPLTLSEKILYSHLHASQSIQAFGRGKSYVDFAPDPIERASELRKILKNADSSPRSKNKNADHCRHMQGLRFFLYSSTTQRRFIRPCLRLRILHLSNLPDRPLAIEYPTHADRLKYRSSQTPAPQNRLPLESPC